MLLLAGMTDSTGTGKPKPLPADSTGTGKPKPLPADSTGTGKPKPLDDEAKRRIERAQAKRDRKARRRLGERA